MGVGAKHRTSGSRCIRGTGFEQHSAEFARVRVNLSPRRPKCFKVSRCVGTARQGATVDHVLSEFGTRALRPAQRSVVWQGFFRPFASHGHFVSGCVVCISPDVGLEESLSGSRHHELLTGGRASSSGVVEEAGVRGPDPSRPRSDASAQGPASSAPTPTPEARSRKARFAFDVRPSSGHVLAKGRGPDPANGERP